MRKIILYIPALLLCCSLQAQYKKWTLEECIQYAIDNNIEIKQRKEEQKSKEVELNTSKWAWLPNLNAGIGETLDLDRAQASNNTIVSNKDALRTTGSIEMNMPVFDGMRIINDIKVKKLDLMASLETLNKAKEALSISIASFYVQALYNKEMLAIAESQVELSNDKVNKTDALVKAGKVPMSQLYDIKAQLAKDEVALTEAKNDLNLSLLDLAQCLELERRETNFDIVAPDTNDPIEQYMGSILPPDNIYNNAVAFKPQIKEQKYLLESQRKKLNIAKSGFYPQLNLKASYGSIYYYDLDGGNPSFNYQFRTNQSKNVSLSLSIPIFNRFEVRNNVRLAKIAINNRELIMENSKKVLYKEIQQAYYSATAAQNKYTSSEKSVIANKEAFNYAEERYNAGKSTVFEYNEAKTKYAQSLSEQIQAKYNFIFRAKILDFYNGTPLTL